MIRRFDLLNILKRKLILEFSSYQLSPEVVSYRFASLSLARNLQTIVSGTRPSLGAQKQSLNQENEYSGYPLYVKYLTESGSYCIPLEL